MFGYQLDEFIDFKQMSYHRFLLTKINLNEIKHRKVVHKIFTNYIPQQQLYLDYECKFRWESDLEKINYIGESLKKLPILNNLKFNIRCNQGCNFKPLLDSIRDIQNIKYLDLNLGCNDLGYRPENIKILRDFVKKLPYDLKHLSLELSSNSLEKKDENMKYLIEVIKCLPFKLQSFSLNFHGNTLRILKLELIECIRFLPINLQNFDLNLGLSNIGGNAENMNILYNCILKLPNNLKYFSLALELNNLHKNNENFKLLGKCLNQLPSGLKQLKLNISENFFEDWNYVEEISKYLPNNLEALSLDISRNNIGQYVKEINYFIDFMKDLPKDLKYLEIILICNRFVLGKNENLDMQKSEKFMRYLGESMKYLPIKLQNLSLNLIENRLDETYIQKFKVDNQQIFEKLKNFELKY